MLAYTREYLLPAEGHAQKNEIGLVWEKLRLLCLDDFAEFFLSPPNAEYPALSRMLPRMASIEVQRAWTGTHGYPLLRQTINFVRSLQYHYRQITGRTLENARILDFGCGYGRIARLMYYFTLPENLYCVDPWDEAIRLCRDDGLLGRLHLSDYLPEKLPFPDVGFDLIYCFSVFTHLSLRCTRTALRMLRRYVKTDGLLVITIRPEEYWLHSTIDPSSTRTAEEILAEHRRNSFAFVPHVRPPIDGDITYGDTSFTFELLAREFPEWKIEGYDRNVEDEFQIRVFLRPAKDEGLSA